MLTVLAYLGAVGDADRARPGGLAASIALFAAALLCKAAAVTSPAVLVILDVYPLRRAGAMVRAGGAPGLAREGPVRHDGPDLHGARRGGEVEYPLAPAARG
jgi:hypothetical protein